MNQVQKGGTHVSPLEFAGAANVRVRAKPICFSDGLGFGVRKKTTTIVFISKSRPAASRAGN